MQPAALSWAAAARSAPIEEVDYDAIPACDGKAAELTLVELDDPISGAMPKFDLKQQQEYRQDLRVERDGAVCDDVCQHAGQGMELVCAVTKPSSRAAMLSMPGAPQISFGNGKEGAVDTRPNTAMCWYRPLLPADQSLETVSVTASRRCSTCRPPTPPRA